MPPDIPDKEELCTEIRGLASMMFVQECGHIESWMTSLPNDDEQTKTIRSALIDIFDIGVAYGVAATMETLQKYEVIPRVHPDPEN